MSVLRAQIDKACVRAEAIDAYADGDNSPDFVVQLRGHISLNAGDFLL